MVLYKKVLLFICIGGSLCVCSDTDYREHIFYRKSKLRQEIDYNKNKMYSIRPRINKQEQDSIAKFDKTSLNSVQLNQKQKEKKDLQICITQLVEKSLREYWMINFPEYKKYIYSKFSESDISELSCYVNKASFSLSSGIDNNYYKSLDEILYGPYWREFAESISLNAPKLSKKYLKIRRSAQKKYPYIFPQSVFYDGEKITKNSEDSFYKNTPFTEAVKSGCDIMRNQSLCTDTNINSFNKLRNVSKIFTTDLHFMVESIYLPNGYYIDLKSPLFAPYYSELSKLIDKIIMLNISIKTLNTKQNKDIKNIKDYFDNIAKQQEISTSEQIKLLQEELENLHIEKTR